jgi:hypothetical protein
MNTKSIDLIQRYSVRRTMMLTILEIWPKRRPPSSDFQPITHTPDWIGAIKLTGAFLAGAAVALGFALLMGVR